MFQHPSGTWLLDTQITNNTTTSPGIDPHPSADRAAIMLPVLGASGELMYYLPTVSNARLGSQHQLPLPANNHPLLNGMRAEQQLQVSPLLPPGLADQLLIRPISGVLPLACQPQQQNAIMAAPPDLAASCGLYAAGFNPLCSQVGQQLPKSMLAPVPNAAQVEKRNPVQSRESQDDSTPYMAQSDSSVEQSSTGHFALQTDNGREEMKSRMFVTTSYVQTTRIATDKQSKSQHGNLTNLGPVEKAVFQQALYNQKKKRNTTCIQDCDVCEVAFNSQVQSDTHFKSKKHSRAMFEYRLGKESNQVMDGRRTTPCTKDFDLINNCDSYETKPLSQDSTKRESGTCVAVIKSDNDDGVAGSGNATEPSTSKLMMKAASVPAIRYHPYKSPYETNRESSKLGEKTADLKHKNVAVGSNQPLAGDELPSDKSLNCKAVQPAIHVPFSQAPVATSGVHSVSVPRSSSFVKPSKVVVTESEQTTRELPDTNAALTGAHHEKREDVFSTSPRLDANVTNKVDDDPSANECASGSSAAGCHSGATKTDPLPITSQDIVATSSGNDKDVADSETKQRNSPAREVHLPDPLPVYITKIERPPGRVLKESLHCTTCDVYVNSENQMKQHLNSLRHKNTLQGIPTPPKPGRDEKPKIRAEQYRCNICKVTLNSDIQLSQHLASQRHKNILEGKPPKPRWSPYDRNQQLLRQPALLHLPSKSALKPTMLNSHQSLSIPANRLANPMTDLNLLTGSTLAGQYLTAQNCNNAHMKHASFVVSDAGIVQTREIVYIGAPGLQPLQQGAATFPSTFATMHGLVQGQQQLQQVLAAPTATGIDWASSGLRLAS